MDENLGQDLQISHEVLNYLHACLQGGFASINMLSQLGYQDFNPDDLSRYQSNLSFMEKTLNQLWQGMPVFSLAWKIPQTQESKATMQLLTQVKNDLFAVVNRLERAFANQETTEEDIKFVIGAYCRHTYTNENFIKGHIEFGRNFTMPQMVENYTPLLPQVERGIESAHLFFEIFSGEERPPVFFQSLNEEVVFLPGAFRTNIHDINRFLATYRAPFHYGLTDIPAEQAEEWQVINVDPLVAGYWWAYSFRAQDMVNWVQNGVQAPREAFFWLCLRFTPQDASEWVKFGFPPLAAATWKQAQFGAKEAMEYIRQGITSPQDATQKRRYPDLEEEPKE